MTTNRPLDEFTEDELKAHLHLTQSQRDLARDESRAREEALRQEEANIKEELDKRRLKTIKGLDENQIFEKLDKLKVEKEAIDNAVSALFEDSRLHPEVRPVNENRITYHRRRLNEIRSIEEVIKNELSNRKRMKTKEAKRIIKEAANRKRPQFTNMTTDELVAFANDWSGSTVGEIIAALDEVTSRITRLKNIVDKLKFAKKSAMVRTVSDAGPILIE